MARITVLYKQRPNISFKVLKSCNLNCRLISGNGTGGNEKKDDGHARHLCCSLANTKIGGRVKFGGSLKVAQRTLSSKYVFACRRDWNFPAAHGVIPLFGDCDLVHRMVGLHLIG